MEFIFGLFVGIAVGSLITAKQKTADERAVLRQEIEQLARCEQDKKIAEGMHKAALQIGGPLPATPEPSVPKEAVTTAASARPNSTNSLDNVSVLLYFGAFLMVSGVGLFVGLSDFSGGVKTTAVLLLALALYTAGLMMHHYMRRLRPVALTLTAIGLICLPFTGVAAYFYSAGAVNGPLIWFVTSLGALLLYVFALWRIRQSLIGYLSIFMCISLWLSIVSVIDAPVYYFGWAAIVLGMIYLLATKFLHLWAEVEAPLSTSATVMVPSALVMTFLFGFSKISLTNLGVTVLLAGAFYVMATWFEKNQARQLTYFSLSYILLPVAVLLLAHDVIHNALTFGWILSAITIVEFAAASLWRKSHASWYQAALAISAIAMAISSLAAAPYFQLYGNWTLYCWLLGLNMVVHGTIAYVSRYRLHALLSLLTLVALPAILGYFVFVPALPALALSSVYVALATLLMFSRRAARAWGFYDLTVLTYSLALLAAWLVGASGATWVPAFVTLCVSALVTVAAVYENTPVVLYGSTLLGNIVLVQWFIWQQPTEPWVFGLSFGGLSLVYYIVSKLLAIYNKAYARPILLSSLAGMYLATFVNLVQTQVSWSTTTLVAAAGALTSYESYRQKQRGGTYVGGGVVLSAFQMALYLMQVREAEVYWHLWALYFAGLAWLAHRDKRTEEKQSFTVFALLLQTVPLAWQALGGDTNLGFVLLAESIGLLLFGLWARYRLVAWWALSTAVGSVLYQLREFQFFVLVLLGAGIIGIGIYMLLRQEKRG